MTCEVTRNYSFGFGAEDCKVDGQPMDLSQPPFVVDGATCQKSDGSAVCSRPSQNFGLSCSANGKDITLASDRSWRAEWTGDDQTHVVHVYAVAASEPTFLPRQQYCSSEQCIAIGPQSFTAGDCGEFQGMTACSTSENQQVPNVNKSNISCYWPAANDHEPNDVTCTIRGNDFDNTCVRSVVPDPGLKFQKAAQNDGRWTVSVVPR